MDNFIGFLSRRYFTGPADQKWNTKGSFVAGKKASSPGTVESLSSDSPIAPVVRCKDKNGVFLDPQLFDCIEELTDIGIRLCEDVSEIAIASFTLGVWMGVMGRVCLRIRNENEEWIVFLGLALNEVERVIGNLSIYRRTFLTAKDFQFFGLLTALGGHDMHEPGSRVFLIRGTVRPERPVR